MNKVKYLTMAFAALFLSATFTACGDDDDNPPRIEENTGNNGNNSDSENKGEEDKGDQNENAGNNSGNENQGNQGNENGGNGENSGNQGNDNTENSGSNANSSENNDKPLSAGTLVDGYYAVDLGLSVKWATCNVGASKPEEYGDYFAWGETKQKTEYHWSTYKWSTYKYGSGYYELIKYCTDRDYGKVDNKTVLEPEDDAATVNWGGAWRMPTLEEWEELLDKEKCTWIWQDDKKGYKVTGPNDSSIFLPAAGERYFTELGYVSDGFYWSSSLDTEYPRYAYRVFFHSGHYGWDNVSRSDARDPGYTVRAVCK